MHKGEKWGKGREARGMKTSQVGRGVKNQKPPHDVQAAGAGLLLGPAHTCHHFGLLLRRAPMGAQETTNPFRP